MADTYTKIHIHLVFAVKYREALIVEPWRQRLYEYMNKIISNREHKVLAINGIEDHVHIFIGLRPQQSISELVQILKRDTSRWINETKLTKKRFRWQEGYGAFSHSKSQVTRVTDYIYNQERHHKKKLFLEEYKNILLDIQAESVEKYLFEPLS